MKKIFAFLICCALSVPSIAQMQSGGSDYVFCEAYDSDGDETEMLGHPNRINVMIVTTAFFGVLQSNLSYAEYNPMTGTLGQYITFDSYRGQRNGWHIYSWNGHVIYIRNDWSRIRVQLSFYQGNYCEYRRAKSDEDINDAATW